MASNPVYLEIVDFFASSTTPQAVADFQLSPAAFPRPKGFCALCCVAPHASRLPARWTARSDNWTFTTSTAVLAAIRGATHGANRSCPGVARRGRGAVRERHETLLVDAFLSGTTRLRLLWERPNRFNKTQRICFEILLDVGLLNDLNACVPRTKLFISHDWEYAQHYDGVVDLLNAVPDFLWENLSVPRDNPIPMLPSLPLSHRTIVHQLDDQMNRVDCAVILAGVYATNSGWIQSEIEAAMAYGKPIIGIRPRGQERISAIVQKAARTMVSWNGASIVEAIRQNVQLPQYTNTLAAVFQSRTSNRLAESPISESCRREFARNRFRLL